MWNFAYFYGRMKKEREEIMKKGILVLPILMLGLTGCGSEKAEKITCTNSTNDVVSGYSTESKYIINYKGKNVDSVETVETVSSDNDEVLSAVETQLNEMYNKTNETYGGYTIKIEKGDGKVTANVTIDYNKMDLDQYVKDQPSLKNFVKDGKMQLDGVKAIYETMGATCK